MQGSHYSRGDTIALGGGAGASGAAAAAAAAAALRVHPLPEGPQALVLPECSRWFEKMPSALLEDGAPSARLVPPEGAGRASAPRSAG